MSDNATEGTTEEVSTEENGTEPEYAIRNVHRVYSYKVDGEMPTTTKRGRTVLIEGFMVHIERDGSEMDEAWVIDKVEVLGEMPCGKSECDATSHSVSSNYAGPTRKADPQPDSSLVSALLSEIFGSGKRKMPWDRLDGRIQEMAVAKLNKVITGTLPVTED